MVFSTELILTVSTLGGCGGLEELILTVSTLGRCGSLEKTDFNSFYFGKSVAVLKELEF